MRRILAALLVTSVVLVGCSTKNKYEKEADKITSAVLANNASEVAGDFDSQARAQVNRVRVARFSDELNDQGKYEGVTETTPKDAPPDTHTFDAKFQKRTYQEVLVLDDDGKVRSWHFEAKTAAP